MKISIRQGLPGQTQFSDFWRIDGKNSVVDDVEAVNLIFFCLRPAIDTDLNGDSAAGIPGLVDRLRTPDVITFTWQNGFPVCFQQVRITFP